MKIFVSYRRQDSARWSGRIVDALSSRYGPGQVFSDIANISPGVDFRSHIEDAVSNADAVLAVIGPHWLDATYRDEGRRRIDDAQDLVRGQLWTAIRLQKVLVPVLVGGAVMPTADMLPGEIASLAERQYVSLDDVTWNQDISRLTKLLDRTATSRWARLLRWKR